MVHGLMVLDAVPLMPVPKDGKFVESQKIHLMSALRQHNATTLIGVADFTHRQHLVMVITTVV